MQNTRSIFGGNQVGVVGVDQDYDLNIMVHDGMTDIHQSHLGIYDMEIYLNGELIDIRNDDSLEMVKELKR